MANSINEWKHNLHVLWFNNFIIGMGFQISMPFVALYVKQLGHFNHFQLSFWSGLAFSASFFVSSWMAPIWGKFADRHGRKKVLMLSATGMGIFSVLMGIALNVYELVTFRLLQGFFSGYVANTSALIASSVPKEHSGKALSTLATGTTSGMLLGPLIGGFIAEIFGYRISFMLTGLGYLIVLLSTIFLVHEHNFTPVSKDESLSARQLFSKLKYPQVVIGMIITTLIIQAGNNSISPIISLYVEQLLHGHGRVALMSGIVSALPGIATIIAAPRFGALGDRIGTHKILLAGLIFAILVYIPQAYVFNIWQLAGLRFLVGISDAALIPQVQTLLAKYSPQKYSGSIFSYNQALQFLGNIVGPMLGSVVSGMFGYSSVFLSTSGLIAINYFWVRHSTKVIREGRA